VEAFEEAISGQDIAFTATIKSNSANIIRNVMLEVEYPFGFEFDSASPEPVFANKVGGLSGPSLKSIAIKLIYDVRKALPKIPIIGTGGVLTGRDAIEMMMAGATLVGIGTGVYYRGVEIFGEVVKEMKEWCKKNDVKQLSKLIGAVK